MAEGNVNIHQRLPDEERTRRVMDSAYSSLESYEREHERSTQDYLNDNIRRGNLNEKERRICDNLASDIALNIAMEKRWNKIKSIKLKEYEKLDEEKKQKILDNNPFYVEELKDNTEFKIINKFLMNQLHRRIGLSVSTNDGKRKPVVETVLVDRSESISNTNLKSTEQKPII